jgi:hypothetical protein
MHGRGQLTNEFEFPVASFHHAGETYLVPELLKQTWVSLSSFFGTCSQFLSNDIPFHQGGTPAIALFASNFR